MDVGFLAVFASILLASEAQSPVYVLNEYSQLVTSSTLQWVRGTLFIQYMGFPNSFFFQNFYFMFDFLC